MYFFVLFYVFLCCSMYFLCCSIYFCVVLCIFCVVLCIFLCCYMYFLCSMYFCVVPCIFVFYVFFSCSMYCLFCVVLCIVCVYMCTELLPPAGYPIAIKNISYHNSSFNSMLHKLHIKELTNKTYILPVLAQTLSQQRGKQQIPTCRISKYCPLLKKMRLTFIARVVPLHSRRRSVENIQILSKPRVSLTAWSFHWSPFVWCFVYNKPRARFMYSSSHTEHYKKKLLSHMHKTRLRWMYFQFEYIGYRSQGKDDRIDPAQTTVMFNSKLHTQHL